MNRNETPFSTKSPHFQPIFKTLKYTKGKQNFLTSNPQINQQEFQILIDLLLK